MKEKEKLFLTIFIVNAYTREGENRKSSKFVL